MVYVGPPPPAHRPDPLVQVLPVGGVLYRIFDPTGYGTTALTFRFNGPRARFDHQRGTSHRTSPASAGMADGASVSDEKLLATPRAPADDPDRGVYYAAPSLSNCLVEVF